MHTYALVYVCVSVCVCECVCVYEGRVRRNTQRGRETENEALQTSLKAHILNNDE